MLALCRFAARASEDPLPAGVLFELDESRDDGELAAPIGAHGSTCSYMNTSSSLHGDLGAKTPIQTLPTLELPPKREYQ